MGGPADHRGQDHTPVSKGAIGTVAGGITKHVRVSRRIRKIIFPPVFVHPGGLKEPPVVFPFRVIGHVGNHGPEQRCGDAVKETVRQLGREHQGNRPGRIEIEKQQAQCRQEQRYAKHISFPEAVGQRLGYRRSRSRRDLVNVGIEKS